ncbi:MAG: hypothetical protein AAF542_12345 [Pseudomonadota bacterium]
MYDAAIEINDIEFSIWQGDQRTSVPAYALLENSGLLFGEQAKKRARLQPLQINNRFVQQLTMVETPELNPYARHHADLAYRFLQFAHQQTKGMERCVFIVPPNYDEQHMAVLLGVAKQCAFDAVGLLDQTVAVASHAVHSLPGVFCDLQLHQMVIGGFDIDGDHVQRTTTLSLDGFGLLDLHERWVRIIADAFIQQCRFDPLHDAAVEQQLWDLLPEKLHNNASDTVFQFDLLNKHHAKIERDQLLAPVEALYQQMDSRLNSFGVVEQIICGDRLAGLPGFAEMDARMQTVEPKCAADALMKFQQRVCTNTATLPFITRLPLSADLDRSLASAVVLPGKVPADTTRSSGQVSHFMIDDAAWPLSEGTIYLDSMGDAIVWTQQAGSVAVAELGVNDENQLTFVPLNGNHYWLNASLQQGSNATLKKGDIIQLTENGAQLRLIEVAGYAGVRGNEA